MRDDHRKALKVVRLIESLKEERLTLDQITERLEVHSRTVRRYLDLIEEVPLPLEKDFYNRYFIAI